MSKVTEKVQGDRHDEEGEVMTPLHGAINEEEATTSCTRDVDNIFNDMAM